MGWQIGASKPCGRHFRLAADACPEDLLPKRTKNSGERQAGTGGHAASVIVPGSPDDPCRQQNLALARILETARRFPDAFRAIQAVLADL